MERYRLFKRLPEVLNDKLASPNTLLEVLLSEIKKGEPRQGVRYHRRV